MKKYSNLSHSRKILLDSNYWFFNRLTFDIQKKIYIYIQVMFYKNYHFLSKFIQLFLAKIKIL